MVFQLFVGVARRGSNEPEVAPDRSVFETFLGMQGEELLVPSTSQPRELGQLQVDELIAGVGRFFRTGGFSGLLGHDMHPGFGSSFDGQLPTQRTSALFLVAVPIEISLASLRRFFGSALDDAVETLRVLHWAPRRVRPVQGSKEISSEDAAVSGASGGAYVSGDFYSVVLLCRTQGAADMLYREYHGRILCDERKVGRASEESTGGPCCYLLFLESVTYREMLINAGEPYEEKEPMPAEVPSVAVELPMCPFCLERLDISVTGIITHNVGWLSSMEWDEVPHSQCCGACSAIDNAGRILAGVEEGPEPICPCCNSGEDLWVCLVCGHLGCGRYAGGHAKHHSTERGHQFGLDLSSGRIWHYAGDVFVHRRLVQMVAASGRFEVALPEPASEVRCAADAGGSKGSGSFREDHLAMELDAVLASRLDYQRTLYEAKLRGLDEQHRNTLLGLQTRSEGHQARQRKLEAKVAEAQQEQRRLERRFGTAQQSKSKASEELEFAKEVNRSLVQNRAEMQRNSDSSSAAAGPSASLPEEDALVLRLRKQVAKLMETVSGTQSS